MHALHRHTFDLVHAAKGLDVLCLAIHFMGHCLGCSHTASIAFCLSSYLSLHGADVAHSHLVQIAAELHAVVREAQQASLVHLAPEGLPSMPRDPLSFIQKVEDTAVALHLLADDYDTVTTW